MSTAQRRGGKQSKLSAWQSLQPKEEVAVEAPVKKVPVKEPVKEEVPEIEPEVEVLSETAESGVDLPKIVKKNKK